MVPGVKAYDASVAHIIFDQLGGGKFIAMTGAKDLVAIIKGLRFRLPARMTKNGINLVTVILDDSTDTYTVEYYKFGKSGLFLVRSDVLVFADNLKSTFTQATGLDVSL